mgnify:FL=1
MSHALLSPSASRRWLECPPSVRLTELMEDKPSAYADEGTLAHSIAEGKLKSHLGYAENPIKCEDALMDEYTDDYVAFVDEQMSVLENPSAFVEQRVDCSKYVPECYGTCDALIISDGVLHICDLKYGTGVKVDAVGNDQLRIYALGAFEMFSCLYDISTVRMSIFQPRLSHCDTWELPIDELLKWANEVLVPAAKQAWNGQGEFKAGEHCRFCKAKSNCRKRAEYNLELARYDFEPPATLDNIEIAAILAKADELVSWVTDVKEYALRQALSGVTYDGFKVVEGRSNRKYTDENAVVEAVKTAGFDPYEHSVLGITAMTALLGKKKFTELLGGIVEKPQGKPTLVPMSDKRPAINTANEDFKEEN